MSVALTYTLSEADYLALKDAAATLSAVSDGYRDEGRHRLADTTRMIADKALRVDCRPDVHFNNTAA